MVNIFVLFFWVVMLCVLVRRYQYFRGIYYLQDHIVLWPRTLTVTLRILVLNFKSEGIREIEDF